MAPSWTTMSGRPSSGSLEVMATRVTDGEGSTRSAAVKCVGMGTSLWFGGQSSVGVARTVRVGGLVSATVTLEAQEDELPEVSVATKDTAVVPRGRSSGAKATTASEEVAPARN